MAAFCQGSHIMLWGGGSGTNKRLLLDWPLGSFISQPRFSWWQLPTYTYLRAGWLFTCLTSGLPNYSLCPPYFPVAEFIDPWLGEKVNSGIGLPHRPASHVAWHACTDPYAGVDLIPQSGIYEFGYCSTSCTRRLVVIERPQIISKWLCVCVSCMI